MKQNNQENDFIRRKRKIRIHLKRKTSLEDILIQVTLNSINMVAEIYADPTLNSKIKDVYFFHFRIFHRNVFFHCFASNPYIEWQENRYETYRMHQGI